MKKTAFFCLFLFALLPLNAQKMIRYITFYPVPYGQHANLTVSDKLMINMGTDNTEFHNYKTEVAGAFSIENGSDIKGFADISGESGNFSTTNEIKSGSETHPSGVVGKAYSYAGSGRTYFGKTGETGIIKNLYSSGSSSFEGAKTFVNGTKLDKLAACSGGAQWRSLRLKGSEECKMYLTCGSGSGDTGCDDEPDFRCKNGYCLEDGACVAGESASRSCVGYDQDAIGGTIYRTKVCTKSGWSYGLWGSDKSRTNCRCGEGKWDGTQCVLPEYIWVCDGGTLGNAYDCTTENVLRSMRCYTKGATATAKELISPTECEISQCVCG